MKQEELLAKRSGNKCELCEANGSLKIYEVPPATGNMDDAILVCWCWARRQSNCSVDRAVTAKATGDIKISISSDGSGGRPGPHVVRQRLYRQLAAEGAVRKGKN